MKQMLSLIKREFWEWQTAFVRTPMVLCVSMTALLLVAVFTNSDKIQQAMASLAHKSVSQAGQIEPGVPEGRVQAGDQYTDIWASNPDALGLGLAAVYAVFVLVLLFVMPTYLLGALHNDRRDRSILFWKSLPIAEHQSALAKLCVAVLAAPAIYGVAAVVTGAVFMLTLAIGGLILKFPLPWPMDFVSALLYSLPSLVVSWLLLALWSLPVFCWLLLCSAWTKRMTFVVAMAVPLCAATLEYWLFDSHYFASAIGDQLSLGLEVFVDVLPRSENIGTALQKSLSAPAFWLGLIFSALQLGVCVWLRENRFEI
jgi:ABC-2 type transport system permease protein